MKNCFFLHFYKNISSIVWGRVGSLWGRMYSGEIAATSRKYVPPFPKQQQIFLFLILLPESKPLDDNAIFHNFYDFCLECSEVPPADAYD